MIFRVSTGLGVGPPHGASTYCGADSAGLSHIGSWRVAHRASGSRLREYQTRTQA